MNGTEFDREVSVTLSAVREAAQLILQVYSSPFGVEFKNAREPVTLADRTSNALLCERILAAFPQDGIVAEESVPDDPNALLAQTSKPRVWFIDPLDGTKEFIARNGEFSIMLGLVIAGEVRLGVVSCPVTAITWVAVVGQGAWRVDPDGSQHRCTVSSVCALDEAALVVSRSHRPDALVRVLNQMKTRSQIACGSVGLKAAQIAEGKADLYIYMTQGAGAKLWDACAPEALVRAAGGRVTDAVGQPIQYVGAPLVLQRGLIASNSRVHEQALAAAGC
jgi:3'(2'), 5'-bisphosphate nucleotidase